MDSVPPVYCYSPECLFGPNATTLAVRLSTSPLHPRSGNLSTAPYIPQQAYPRSSIRGFFFVFVSMHDSSTRSATRPSPRAPGGGGSFSAKARRRIRQAVALGTELDLHSVKAFGVVWTLRHRAPEHARAPDSHEQLQTPQPAASQKRSTRSCCTQRALQSAIRDNARIQGGVTSHQPTGGERRHSSKSARAQEETAWQPAGCGSACVPSQKVSAAAPQPLRGRISGLRQIAKTLFGRSAAV